MAEYAMLRDGVIVPVDMMTWATMFEESDRRVALTQLGEATVSTVFLGLNHAFGGGRPLWFETMVFGGEHDQDMDRYATLEEAMAGHERMVALVTNQSQEGKL